MQEYFLFGSFNGDRTGMQTQDGEITALLAGWREGDRTAMERLYPLIRAELHRLARRHLGREGRHHTVQPSTLVQEAVLRLLPAANCGWRDRAHFYAVASHVMRHVLVDYARKKRSYKRGREFKRVPFEEAIVVSTETSLNIVAADEAMRRLAAIDARKAQVLELCLFGGLTTPEIAETLEIAVSAVRRDLNFAKVWLARELGSSGHDK